MQTKSSQGGHETWNHKCEEIISRSLHKHCTKQKHSK